MMITGQLGRETMGQWLNSQGLIGGGAEVGCARGDFAKSVLSSWRGVKYYMIDPWAVLPESEYLERQETMDYEAWYQACVEMSKADSRIRIIREKSLEASSIIFNESMDWVYLDAAHDLKNITQDLNAWYPKVKHGGLFGGHDFMTRMDGDSRIQVDRAVEDFAYQNKLTFTVTPCTSWWMIKP